MKSEAILFIAPERKLPNDRIVSRPETLLYPIMKDRTTMNKIPLYHLKRARAGIALIGMLAMLSLSSCTPADDTKDGLNGNPTDDTSVSASATDNIDSDTGITYPPPAKGQTTSTGESAEKAEARYLEKATEAADNENLDKSDKELLAMGYETCGHMLNAKDKADAHSKIKTATKDEDTENLLVTLSDNAATTICPEFSKL